MTRSAVHAVAGEAAVCFSLLTWLLAAQNAWPTNNPLRFAAAVLGGAAIALILCHMIPAMLAPSLFKQRRGPLEVVRRLVAAWFIVGAAGSAIWLAKSSGEWILWRQRDATYQRAGLGILVGLCALALARQNPNIRTWVLLLLALLGATFVATSFIAQFHGLSTRNPQLFTEEFLADDFKVFIGILLACAPASIFALEFGRQESSRRKIVWAGVWGMALPVICSVTLTSFAKIAGMRLYWRPSVPIGFEQAFQWYWQKGFPLLPVVAVLSFGPLICLLFWMEALIPWRGSWKRLVALALALLLGAALIPTNEELFRGYFIPWCWSILIASALLGAWTLLSSRR
jgi:hypothetical protein